MSSAEDWNKAIIKEFRENDGVVGGMFADVKLVLLHTTGAKSGKERVNPLVSLTDGDTLAVVASAGGAPSHPDWYYNILANPKVSVEYGTDKFDAVARVTEEPERSELYAKMEDQFDSFSDYKKQTDRVIPVIALDPVS